MSIERLDNFSLKLPFWMQMTKKDLTILVIVSFFKCYQYYRITIKWQN